MKRAVARSISVIRRGTRPLLARIGRMGEVVVPRNFRVSRRRPSPRARARGGPSLRWRKRRALWISRGRDSPRLRSQLLEELEKFEKGQNGDMNCSAGAPPVSRSEAAVAGAGPRPRRELRRRAHGRGRRRPTRAGLKDSEDIFLTTWNASILGPMGTAFENRLYSCIIARARRARRLRPRLPTRPATRAGLRSDVPIDAARGHLRAQGRNVDRRRARHRGAAPASELTKRRRARAASARSRARGRGVPLRRT